MKSLIQKGSVLKEGVTRGSVYRIATTRKIFPTKLKKIFFLDNLAEDIVFRDKKVFVKGSPARFIPFGELAKKAEGLGHGRLIIGQGQWAPSNTQFPDRKTKYGNVSGSYSFATQIAEVAVDQETGQVKVLDVTIGDDCGQVINPMSVEGQAEGSVLPEMDEQWDLKALRSGSRRGQ